MLDITLTYKTELKAGPGKLLISEPMLQDACFQRSVVYLCHHDTKESVGYVINKRAEYLLSEFIEDLAGHDFPLFTGGPVGLDTLHLLHTVPKLIGGEHIMDGIYWGGEIDQAIDHILAGKITPLNCKFLIGYSGWSEGQLDAELDMNAWLVSEGSSDLLFEQTESIIWQQAVSALGRKFNPLLFMPTKPEFN